VKRGMKIKDDKKNKSKKKKDNKTLSQKVKRGGKKLGKKIIKKEIEDHGSRIWIVSFHSPI
jgi:hypothetical protein